MRTTFPALLAGLAFVGCVVVQAPPPDGKPHHPKPKPDPDPTPTATATVTPTATPTVTPTATGNPPAQPGAAGAVCGSRGMQPCGADLFCDYHKGSQCGALDQGGICKAIPTACTREFHQVCGCDGQTYSNPCSANAKGVAVSRDGKCD